MMAQAETSELERERIAGVWIVDGTLIHGNRKTYEWYVRRALAKAGYEPEPGDTVVARVRTSDGRIRERLVRVTRARFDTSIDYNRYKKVLKTVAPGSRPNRAIVRVVSKADGSEWRYPDGRRAKRGFRG